jgi:hypothetical protein
VTSDQRLALASDQSTHPRQQILAHVYRPSPSTELRFAH